MLFNVRTKMQFNALLTIPRNSSTRFICMEVQKMLNFIRYVMVLYFLWLRNSGRLNCSYFIRFNLTAVLNHKICINVFQFISYCTEPITATSHKSYILVIGYILFPLLSKSQCISSVYQKCLIGAILNIMETKD